MTRRPNPLGVEQKYVLIAMRRKTYGQWYDGCGWKRVNRSRTVEICRSLVRRGLATEQEHYEVGTLYRLNDAGWEEAGRLMRAAGIRLD
jgi:DNA-binding PadR family transcriptional regulator